MKIIVHLALAIFYGCSTFSENTSSSSVDFKEENNQFFFPMLIDDKNVVCFWDTGATTSSILKSKFPDSPSMEVGKVISAFGNLETQTKVEVKNIHLGNIYLTKVPLNLREKIKGQKDCVAGMDLFQDISFRINFADKKIQFTQIDNLNSYDLIPSKILILPITVEDLPLTAAFDTGANYTAMDKSLIEKLGEKASFQEEISGKDALGNSKPVRLFKIKSIQIGKIKFKDILIVEADFSPMRLKKADFPLVFLGVNEMVKYNWYFNLKNKKWSVE